MANKNIKLSKISKEPLQAPPVPAEKAAFSDIETTPKSQSPDSIGRGRKILVVDDNETVVKAFQLKLTASGFKVLSAFEAGNAMALASEEDPALIILDINLPPKNSFSTVSWDGLNLLYWMKRFQEQSNVPIIIVSGEEASLYEEKCRAAGAVGYFQKPVNYPELLASILQVLDGKSAA